MQSAKTSGNESKFFSELVLIGLKVDFLNLIWMNRIIRIWFCWFCITNGWISSFFYGLYIRTFEEKKNYNNNTWKKTSKYIFEAFYWKTNVREIQYFN